MKAACLLPIGLSAVSPGCGHIAAGRPARGLLLFFLFGLAVDGYLFSQAQTILPPERASVPPLTIKVVALVLGGLVWAYAIGDSTASALRCRRIEASAGAISARLRAALIAYLRGDLAAAAQALHAALRINAHDADALFYLGVVYAAAGHVRKARRALYQCIRYDAEGKWDDEAHDHLHAIEGAPPPVPPPLPETREEPPLERQA